jgi:sarcosine oxidase delta subunit
MLAKNKLARPEGVIAINADISDFREKHGATPNTRDVRNTFYVCQGTIGHLEPMWRHIRGCEKCMLRLHPQKPKL